MSKFKDLTGQRFGRLTALSVEYIRKMPHGTAVVWKCQCDCGNVHYANACNLKRGFTRSCGCLRSERMKAMRAEQKELSQQYPNKLLQGYKVFIKATGEEHYFTSMAAIVDSLEHEQIGCTLPTLWNAKIRENGRYENKCCVITTIVIVRKRQSAGRNNET